MAFLERKSRVKFTKVRLIIRVFIFALSSPPFSAASFCGYTFSSSAHPSWRCFFCTVRVDKGFEWVRDFWRLPRYYQRILIFVGRHGHEYKVSPSRTLSKGQKNSTCFQKNKKVVSLCENHETKNRRMMPMLLQNPQAPSPTAIMSQYLARTIY